MERQHIIDAAYRCLDRNAGATASITEILQEAGLGTRAFYRNFDTKHDVFLQMFRRDCEVVQAQIREKVARAETPAAALCMWMDQMFENVSDPRRRKRMAILYSDELRQTPGFPRELELLATAEESALAAILHRGCADGTFTHCSPEADARSIRAAIDAALLKRFREKTTTSVTGDVEQLIGFVLRGVGCVSGAGRP